MTHRRLIGALAFGFRLMFSWRALAKVVYESVEAHGASLPRRPVLFTTPCVHIIMDE